MPTLYRFDIAPYLRLVEETRGAIGWRLHGNMLHLAHGNPAITFSNCSRAQSFSDALGLPTIASPDGRHHPEAVLVDMLERFLDPATFAPVAARYAAIRATAAEFLQANGLAHRLVAPEPALAAGAGARSSVT